MLKEIRIRTQVLAAHGMLALALGLAFFYLRATMSNLFFEAISVAVALMLAAAALVLAALTDWFAAINEGVKHAHRFALYLLAGLALAIAGFLMGYFPQITLRWLVLVAAMHALAFGIFAIAFAFRTTHHPLERGAMYLLGGLSVIFSGVLANQDLNFESASATNLLGIYLCFVGIKMLFLAWDLRRKTASVHPVVRLASASH
jgi:uncharacterized membrane protein HdeD (DUF308 family)